MSDIDTAVSISDRTYSSDITEEFLTHYAEISDRDEAINALEWAIRRFERTYNAVATLQTAESRLYGELGYSIKVIAALDADRDEIRRGLQNISYWVAEEYEP